MKTEPAYKRIRIGVPLVSVEGAHPDGRVVRIGVSKTGVLIETEATRTVGLDKTQIGFTHEVMNTIIEMYSAAIRKLEDEPKNS